MSMKATRDINKPVKSIAPGVIITTTQTGTGVDLANVNANTFVFLPGTITDGTHTPKLQYSDDNSTNWTDVPAADQAGTFSALVSSTVQQVSYIGAHRYVRAVSTVTGSPATGGYYTAFAIVTYRKQP